MILVTTPTGHTGRHVLTSLSSPVRAFVRDSSRLHNFTGEIVQGDLRQPDDLDRALQGVESAFFCVPQSGHQSDIPAYYRSFTEPFGEAARRAGVKRIVAIGGGDGAEPFPGIGEGLAQVEACLFASCPDVRILRCGYFMENLFWMLNSIAKAGIFSLPLAGDVPLPFVAARDLGAAAGRLLEEASWQGRQGVAAHGPARLSCDDAASILTEALGFSVAYRPISANAYCETLVGFGVSEAMGRSLGEMFRAISEGRDMGRADLAFVTCPTTLTKWISEGFAQAVQEAR